MAKGKLIIKREGMFDKRAKELLSENAFKKLLDYMLDFRPVVNANDESETGKYVVDRNEIYVDEHSKGEKTVKYGSGNIIEVNNFLESLKEV